jgi:flavin reductase (DIM6/NTAB) family NADH-FMN oxidoreductase RutF
MRTALGRFATGVTIITCRDADGAPVGLTANSFQALSLDPPLVLWSLRLESPTLAAFGVARHFSVNVLAESQIDLSRRFASSEADKFAAGHWRDGEAGVPLLDGAAAIFECETASTQPAGDHLLIIGRVLRLSDGALPPLLFHGGRYHLLGEIL